MWNRKCNQEKRILEEINLLELFEKNSYTWGIILGHGGSNCENWALHVWGPLQGLAEQNGSDVQIVEPIQKWYNELSWFII